MHWVRRLTAQLIIANNLVGGVMVDQIHSNSITFYLYSDNIQNNPDDGCSNSISSVGNMIDDDRDTWYNFDHECGRNPNNSVVLEFAQAISIRTVVLVMRVFNQDNPAEVRIGDQILFDGNPVIETIVDPYMAELIVDCDETARYIHLSSTDWVWFHVYDYQVYSEKHIGSSV